MHRNHLKFLKTFQKKLGVEHIMLIVTSFGPPAGVNRNKQGSFMLVLMLSGQLRVYSFVDTCELFCKVS